MIVESVVVIDVHYDIPSIARFHIGVTPTAALYGHCNEPMLNDNLFSRPSGIHITKMEAPTTIASAGSEFGNNITHGASSGHTGPAIILALDLLDVSD